MIKKWTYPVRSQPEPGEWIRLYKDLPNYREIRRKLERSRVVFWETPGGFHGGGGGEPLREYTTVFVPLIRLSWFKKMIGE